jgi:two-component system, OmpR family, response regulator
VLEPGKVLVIEDDLWTGTVLPDLLRSRGHEVDVSGEARLGFLKACEWRPDCIVCTLELPDIDGFWVARKIRTEPSSVSTTPFLFVTQEAERDARMQGFNVGADAYLVRPCSNEEAVAQVEALIEMARRLRTQRDSFRASEPVSAGGKGTAFKGDLELMSLATVLMVVGMERRSGRLRVVTDGHKAELVVIADTFATGTIDAQSMPPLDVLREVLKWKKGKFYFRPLSEVALPNVRHSVSALLLEAMRLDDESGGRN